jgi:hypothetical protein
LFFTLNLDGERVSVGAQTMDQPGPPDTLLRTPDTGQGWELITRFITSLEKYEVRSLVRPILVGDPYYHDPATCWIIA